MKFKLKHLGNCEIDFETWTCLLTGWFCLAPFESLRHFILKQTDFGKHPTASENHLFFMIIWRADSESGTDSVPIWFWIWFNQIELPGRGWIRLLCEDFEIMPPSSRAVWHGWLWNRRPWVWTPGWSICRWSWWQATWRKQGKMSFWHFCCFVSHCWATPGSTFSQRKAVQCAGKPMQCSWDPWSIPMLQASCRPRVWEIHLLCESLLGTKKLNCNFALWSVVVKSCLRCGAWECTRQRAWSHRPSLCGSFAMDFLWTRELVSELCRSASVGLSWLRKLHWHACQNWYAFKCGNFVS